MVKYASNIGKSISKGMKTLATDIYEGTKYLVKENIAKSGIPTNRSYWKEHPVDAVLSIASLATGGAGVACDAYVLSDPLNQAYLRDGTLPEDVTLIPPHLHQSKGIGDDTARPRNLNLGDYASIGVPIALLALPPIIEGVKYHRWKKSIQEIAESAKKF